MDTEEIDDLFRNELGDHATPPAADLWARLQARTAATDEAAQEPPARPEQVDELFRRTLAAYPTPPSRELWERLEDEHLRPRKRRGAAWWPLAMAAAVALFLVAGGALWWRTGEQGTAGVLSAATTVGKDPTMARNVPTRDAEVPATALTVPTMAPTAPTMASTAPTMRREPLIFSRQATRRYRASSGVAGAAAGPKPGTNRAARPLVAPPARQPETPMPNTVAQGPDAAPGNSPPALAPTPLPAPVLASTAAVIVVEVKPGGGQAAPAVAAGPAAAEAEAPRGRRWLSSLLQQANHLSHGERLSLAEATGLPQNVTLQARLGGRTISKTIQL